MPPPFFGFAGVSPLNRLPQVVGAEVATTPANETEASGSDLVLPVPAGVKSGDILVALTVDEFFANFTGGGWTEVENDVHYRVAGSSEPASYTFTASGADRDRSGLIVAVRNGALGNTQRNIDTTDPTLPLDLDAITVANSGALLLLFSALTEVTNLTDGGFSLPGADPLVDHVGGGTGASAGSPYVASALYVDRVDQGTISAGTYTVDHSANEEFSMITGVVIEPA